MTPRFDGDPNDPRFQMANQMTQMGWPQIPGNPAFDDLALYEQLQQMMMGQNVADQIGQYYNNVYTPAANDLQKQLEGYANQNKLDYENFNKQYQTAGQGLTKQIADIAAQKQGAIEGYGTQYQTAGQDLSKSLMDMANRKKAAIEGFGTQYANTAANQRAQLAQNLLNFGKQQFEQASPDILADLNRRGLLSSPTEVANAQAQALKQINLANQGSLLNFDLDSYQNQNRIAQEALNAGLAGEDPALAKELFSQGQSIKEKALEAGLAGQDPELLKQLFSGNQDLQKQAMEAGMKARDPEFAKQMFADKQGIIQQALGAQLQGQEQGLNSALELNRMKLQGQLNQESQQAEMDMAQQLAKQQGRNNMITSLIGAGGSILGGGLPSILSMFGKGAPAATPAVPGAAAAGGGLGGLGTLGMGALGAAAAYGVGSGSGQLLGNALFKGDDASTAARKGAQIGALMGPVGGPLGALLGGLSQSHVASQISQQAKNLVSQPVKTIANAPKNVAKAVSKGIKKAFCFHPFTSIEMADGSTRSIMHIRVDDEVRGGTVESVRTSSTPDGTMYNYKGILVTGSHAVKEKGKWIRIEDSPESVAVHGGHIVYSLCTTDHRLYSNGIEFADEHETDDYENLSMRESLIALNQQEREKVGV